MTRKSTQAAISAKAKQVARASVMTVAGMALSDKRDLVRLAAHAGDLMIKGEWSSALADGYNFFMNKGLIDSDYLDSDRFTDLAPEFKQVVDKPYGLEQLAALRRIFINLAMDNQDGSHKKYLLDLALSMTEPEIKVLLADEALARNRSVDDTAALRSAGQWIREIVQLSGLKHENLVLQAEEGLTEKGLLTRRQLVDASRVAFLHNTGRRTSMGAELCQLMELEDDPSAQALDQ